MPLRVVFWLLVSSVLGGGIGLAIAHRPGGTTSVEASAPVVTAHAEASAPAPPLVYWNVRRHLASDLERPGLHPVSGTATASHTLDTSETARAPQSASANGEVVTFSSGPRTFAAPS